MANSKLTYEGPFFTGGSGYFQIGNIQINFYAKNKQGSGNNKYPWFEDEDVEKAKQQAERIVECWNNYDEVKALNAELVKALEAWNGWANQTPHIKWELLPKIHDRTPALIEKAKSI